MKDLVNEKLTRRSLLTAIGLAGGSAAMYDAMLSMGYAATSDFAGPITLSGDAKGKSVLILGAGIAGMVAAYEMRKAGYKVKILEYNGRPGGRNWSLHAGDSYTDIGGTTQKVNFDKGLYFNPGPWRLPYHHQGILHYCKLLNVPLESFVMDNNSAYVHSANSFGGKPKRFREVAADQNGYVSELLAKATSQNKLDDLLDKDEKDGMLRMLRTWGGLDKNYEYKRGEAASDFRGYDIPPGGGLMPGAGRIRPDAAQGVVQLQSVERTLFSSSNGIFRVSCSSRWAAWARSARLSANCWATLIQYDCKVTNIHQDDKGVTVTYVDTKKGGAPKTEKADWCVCTIPVSILSQIPMNVGAKMRTAIDSLPYLPAVKVGLQFKRRFWEEDDDDLWRQHLYRPADLQHQLSQPRLLRKRPGGTAGRLYLSQRHAGL